MKEPYAIIRKLLLTEKGTRLTEKENKYVFRVHPESNKLEIKDAVQRLFRVHVVGVNTLNRLGKQKRDRKMKFGRRPTWKRAIVTLKEGEKIELT